MIYDHISNIERYRTLSHSIYNALRFLANADANIEAKVHPLSEYDRVNVQDYMSLKVNPVGYETHRKYVDIQYAITGHEHIAVRQLPTIKITTPYSEERDMALCADDGKPYTDVTIGDGYFAILFPNDAHMPQLAVGDCEPVKKAIAKIDIAHL